MKDILLLQATPSYLDMKVLDSFPKFALNSIYFFLCLS